MGFLIDTSIWVAVERGHLGPADVHEITHQPIFLSPVNLAELQMGVEMIEARHQRPKALVAIADANASLSSESITAPAKSLDDSLQFCESRDAAERTRIIAKRFDEAFPFR